RAALKRVERAVLDDQQLFVRMLMRRVRRLPGIERRDVNLELLERRRRRAHHLTHGAPVVRLCVSGRPRVDGRLLNVLLRGERADRARRRDRDEKQAERKRLHGAQGTPTRRFAVRFGGWTARAANSAKAAKTAEAAKNAKGNGGGSERW